MVEQRVVVTWLGHATVLIALDGYRVLTDPALTSRLAHLRRRVPASDIEPVDAILLSHVHMDHLHRPSLRLVSVGARIVVPLGGKVLVKRVDAASVEAVVPNDRITAGPFNVTVVHAEHRASRGSHSRVRAEPVGYVLQVGRRHIYFAGDTDLFEGMHHLGPIDLALLPIGGWASRLGTGHLDPARAAMATSWIQPSTVVPIHWGTYSPIHPRRSDPPWLNAPTAAFRDKLSDLGLADRLNVVKVGHTFEL